MRKTTRAFSGYTIRHALGALAARPGPAPSRGAFTPEVTLTRKQYPGVPVGRGREQAGGGAKRWQGGKCGAKRRADPGKAEDASPHPATPSTGWRSGGSGGGKPLAGTREPHTLTCPSPSPPARRRLREAAGRARTQGARTRTAGRFLELALRPFSPSPAHSKPGARSAAAAVACAQLPWPPPPRETLPRPSHSALLEGGSRWSPGPHFRTPPGPVWPNRREAAGPATRLSQ
ncbi:unnamed protein product [Nyctereutes procyonoides]|uniref:(raccoon dog) hypothetical protein n=1 Tax=Nyctereutes procyonoides TaxID=34880 RepID=A0A811ZZ68_NYCPR|nr:unnamed protein product [Nyctereutes procyonoides]